LGHVAPMFKSHVPHGIQVKPKAKGHVARRPILQSCHISIGVNLNNVTFELNFKFRPFDIYV
jgi:hypothetical protein